MSVMTRLFSILLLAFSLSACQGSHTESNKAATDYAAELDSSASFSHQLLLLSKNNIIYFPLDSSVIADEYTEYLKATGTFLANNPTVGVVIEGHADERGTPEYNIVLGEKRARTVESVLISYGVRAEQLDIVSFGKSRPAVLGHNETSWSMNRRAVLDFQELPE